MATIAPVISSDTLNRYFWPVFLHMVVPFLIVGIVFLLIRLVCARIFRHTRYLRVLVDGAIILLFLLMVGLMVPIVFDTLNFPVRVEESAGSVTSDVDSALDAYIDAFESAMPDDSEPLE